MLDKLFSENPTLSSGRVAMMLLVINGMLMGWYILVFDKITTQSVYLIGSSIAFGLGQKAVSKFAEKKDP